jgi:hypothetical protein
LSAAIATPGSRRMAPIAKRDSTVRNGWFTGLSSSFLL